MFAVLGVLPALLFQPALLLRDPTQDLSSVNEKITACWHPLLLSFTTFLFGSIVYGLLSLKLKGRLKETA